GDRSIHPDGRGRATYPCLGGRLDVEPTIEKETVMTRPLGDPARDEREVTQLIEDLYEAVVKADVATLERLLHEDYVHHRPRGTVENRAQYLENRKARRVDFESLVADEIKVRVYGDNALVTGW